MTDVVKDICDTIDSQSEELAGLVLKLANTYAPVGRETDVAKVVSDWYEENGIPSRVVEISEGRGCTVGRLSGDGSGQSLLFNAHLDTEVSGPDHDLLMQTPDDNVIGAERVGDIITGHAAMNDRHAHALFMIAARAVKDAGVALRGDVILTSVAGETGQAPIDEFVGPQYVGKGLGTTFLVDHGIRADYAIVSETTDFALCWYSCGAAYFKITLRGKNMYTPRLIRADHWTESPNAVHRAGHMIQIIEEWASAFTERRTADLGFGVVRPHAQIGAIRGGIPYRPNRSASYAALYLDVRVLPDERVEDVEKELVSVVKQADPDAEVDMYLFRRGAIGENIEPLADTIAAAHQRVRGDAPPETVESAVLSMWRDTNVLNNAGIPTINYGPGRGQAAVQGTGGLNIKDLADVAKVYALTILDVCSDIRIR